MPRAAQLPWRRRNCALVCGTVDTSLKEVLFVTYAQGQVLAVPCPSGQGEHLAPGDTQDIQWQPASVGCSHQRNGKCKKGNVCFLSYQVTSLELIQQ